MEFEREALKEAGLEDERCQKIQAVLVRVGEDAAKLTLNASKARLYLADILSISTGEDMPAFIVRTWMVEWKARILPNVAPATQERYKTSLRMFIRWLGEGADRPSESVTIAQVRKFREFIEEGGRSLRTCHYYLADVGSAFRAAVREGLLTHNPVSALEARTGEPEVKRKPFEVEEVRALLAAVPSTEWKGLILLGAFAGLRLGGTPLLSSGRM